MGGRIAAHRGFAHLWNRDLRKWFRPFPEGNTGSFVDWRNGACLFAAEQSSEDMEMEDVALLFVDLPGFCSCLWAVVEENAEAT